MPSEDSFASPAPPPTLSKARPSSRVPARNSHTKKERQRRNLRRRKKKDETRQHLSLTSETTIPNSRHKTVQTPQSIQEGWTWIEVKTETRADLSYCFPLSSQTATTATTTTTTTLQLQNFGQRCAIFLHTDRSRVPVYAAIARISHAVDCRQCDRITSRSLRAATIYYELLQLE